LTFSENIRAHYVLAWSVYHTFNFEVSLSCSAYSLGEVGLKIRQLYLSATTEIWNVVSSEDMTLLVFLLRIYQCSIL